MNKKVLGKMTLIAVAVSMLALSGTAEAASLRGNLRMTGAFEQAWQWLAKLWPGVGGDQEKYGVGIDPDGQPAPVKNGGGIDPDGKPEPAPPCCTSAYGGGIDPDGGQD